MSVSRAFDLAQFVNAPANLNDGVVVDVLGPPFTTRFAPLVVGSQSGVVVGSSMPAANAQNQILISGPGPSFAWGLGVQTGGGGGGNTPAATANHQMLMSDVSLTWQDTTIATVMSLGNAVTTTSGGTFVSTAQLVFTPSAAPAVCIDGGDPNFSKLDNFFLDSGTF